MFGMFADVSVKVYARAASYGGSFAVMYSWYWPKDSPSTGLGHRHDWESCVVSTEHPSNHYSADLARYGFLQNPRQLLFSVSRLLLMAIMIPRLLRI